MSEDDKKRFDQILFSAFPDDAVVESHVQNAAQSKVDLMVAKVSGKIKTREFSEWLLSAFTPSASKPSGNVVADLEAKKDRFEKIADEIHLPPKEVLDTTCILS